MNETQAVASATPYISDYAVIIKKMRLIRKLNRKQASLLFDFSFKNLERLENGRGMITPEKFKEFQDRYNFSNREVDELRSGKIVPPADPKSSRKKITTEKRTDRRFCHRHVTRDCKVLKELRILKNIDQYSASQVCGLGRNTIGFIENGRVHLTDKKIRNIVESYGFTMEFFQQLVRLPLLRHEMIEQCQKIIAGMDENKLRIIMPMLHSMER